MNLNILCESDQMNWKRKPTTISALLLTKQVKEIIVSTQKKKIIDARADSEGDITHVKFSGNKNFTSITTAIPMADRGDIENAHVVRAVDKKVHLRTNPDKTKRNNLDDMAGDT